MPNTINGILLLDKPAGLSSNQALQQVKRLFNAKKAGHTGSLDPIATGMLPICFGEATKFSQFLLESDKIYEVIAKLGIETTTGDSEGEIVKQLPVKNIPTSQLESVLTQFSGYIDQVPPMFSAIKFQGKPLYKLARLGVQIERKPRRIFIFSLRLMDYKHDQLHLYIHCSKGTYIRSLISDIGRELGYGAHVISLRRLAVTPYDPNKMHSMPYLKTCATLGAAELNKKLLPVESALAKLPAVKLTTAALFYLRQGQPVRAITLPQTTMVRLFSEDNAFLGVGEMMADGRVQPLRLLAQNTPLLASASH